MPNCKICFLDTTLCECPECPTCGKEANPSCYVKGPSAGSATYGGCKSGGIMLLNQTQLILRTERRIRRMEEELDVEINYLQWLNGEEDHFDEWSAV